MDYLAIDTDMSTRESRFLKWLTGILLAALIPFSLIGITNMVQMRPIINAATKTLDEVKRDVDNKVSTDMFQLYIDVEREKSQVLENSLQRHMQYDTENFERIYEELKQIKEKI